MPIFITLATLTDSANEGVERLTAMQATVEAALSSEQIQGNLADLSWTLGAHDLVINADFPSAEQAAAFARILQEVLPASVETLTVLNATAVDTAIEPV